MPSALLTLRSLSAPASLLRRGPHDPPGTRFRSRQTFELYGYWPDPVTERPVTERPEYFGGDWVLAEETSPSTPDAMAESASPHPVLPQPVRPQPAKEAFEEEISPIISLVEARLLVEECALSTTRCEAKRILPYLEALALSVGVLRERLEESSDLDSWLEQNGL